jgi:hypothetical protein
VITRRRLRKGDRIRVGGGYDSDPKWLAEAPDGGSYTATVERFIDGPNGHPAAVVVLDRNVNLVGANSGEPISGRYLLLTFAWRGMSWRKPGPRLHVHLFDQPPSEYPSEPEFLQRWVESHADWEFAGGRGPFRFWRR